MLTVSTTNVIEIKYIVSGFEYYGFGTDNKLYNIKTGREKKKTMNGRSIGFWIGKQFYSLNKLKPLLIRPPFYKVTF